MARSLSVLCPHRVTCGARGQPSLGPRDGSKHRSVRAELPTGGVVLGDRGRAPSMIHGPRSVSCVDGASSSRARFIERGARSIGCIARFGRGRGSPAVEAGGSARLAGRRGLLSERGSRGVTLTRRTVMRKYLLALACSVALAIGAPAARLGFRGEGNTSPFTTRNLARFGSSAEGRVSASTAKECRFLRTAEQLRTRSSGISAGAR
jgi:hypothetical protein